jgi:hypothetical protein
MSYRCVCWGHIWGAETKKYKGVCAVMKQKNKKVCAVMQAVEAVCVYRWVFRCKVLHVGVF